jgi:Prolipoprotein diacylglyceryl transferase
MSDQFARQPESARDGSRWRFRRSPFVHCGIAGLIVALGVSQWLTLKLGLSPSVQLACALTAVAGLLGTALAGKILTGQDGFVFYRDAITALTLVAVTLHFLHQPILAYLDVTILGAGVFQAFGRIGCLSVGCCHGRPCRFGIRYSHIHAETGFPPYLVGVRLFPVQAVESLCVFGIVYVGCRILLTDPRPGSATAFYVLAYAIARFSIEFFRGDDARPFYAGFSQAQWISLILAAAVFAAERLAILPPSPWHSFVPPLLGVAMIAVSAHRHLDPVRQFALANPHHLRELAEFLRNVSSNAESCANQNSLAPEIPIFSTSAGLCLSFCEFTLSDFRVLAFTLSRPAEPLTTRQAYCVAALLGRLSSFSSRYQIQAASPGIFHALFPAATSSWRPQR